MGMNWQSISRWAATVATAMTLAFSSGVSLAAPAPMSTDVSFQTAFDPPGFASQQFVKVLEEAFRVRLSQTGIFEPRNQHAGGEQKKKNSDAKLKSLKCLISGTVTVGTDYYKTHEAESQEAERNPKVKEKSSSKSHSSKSKKSKATVNEPPPTVLAITIDARVIDPTTGEILSVANTAAKASQPIKLPSEDEMKSENFGDSPFGELTIDAAAQIVTQFNAQAEKIQKKLTHEPTNSSPSATGEQPVIQEQ